MKADFHSQFTCPKCLEPASNQFTDDQLRQVLKDGKWVKLYHQKDDHWWSQPLTPEERSLVLKHLQGELHQDWKGEPVFWEFKPLPHGNRNRSVAYIIGNGQDGKRYCRTVEVSAVDEAAKRQLQDTFERVRRIGPSACREFVPDGDLPSEADMPEWNDERD